MSDLIQVRRGTSAQWSAANPVLAEGEPGFDTTTGDFKIGNGLTAWASIAVRYVTIPTTWTAVVFAGAWVNFGAPRQVAEYRKIGDEVQLRGLVKSGAIPSTVFTLPAGFRPPAEMDFGTNSNGAHGWIYIQPDGTVHAQAGSNADFSIACKFSVTA